jgi:Cd2+/Zn2+-exporting ATPase
MNQLSFDIHGMDCADCARTIEKGVAQLEGVSACSVNFTAAKLRVIGDVPAATVITRIRALGYTVSELPRDQLPVVHDQSSVSRLLSLLSNLQSAVSHLPQTGLLGFVGFLLERRNTSLALLGVLLILPGLLFSELLPMLGWEHAVWHLTSLLALLVAGCPVALSAWRTLVINREISINLLMTLAAVGAVVIGAYSEAGLVMVLFAIGEALEGYTMQQVRASIRSLLQIAPNTATLLRACMDCRAHLGQGGYTGGPCPFCGVEEEQVAVESIQVGDLMLVKPGERIAMDGQVQRGLSGVNQASITGESLPVEKSAGATVFAGSINGEGVLEVVVTHLAADNTISRMIHLVEEAQERRAPVQRVVDQLARYYTPAVVAAALIVAVLPPLLWGAPFWNSNAHTQGWLYRALELLVVACPCALVISTPVSLVSAIVNAARRGVLIKGGAYLEALSRVHTFAFDKTGTLTLGVPRLVAVRSIHCQAEELRCENCDDLLALTSAVECRSEHSLGRAIVEGAVARNVHERYLAGQQVTALVGQGVRGLVEGRAILIGSHRYFDQHLPHDANQCSDLHAAAQQGYTSLLVSVDERYLGYLTVADSVRAESRITLERLRLAGVQHLVMLTGDNQGAAQRIAEQVGVTAVRAELLPQDKVRVIGELRQQLGGVAMVGDGINDAPALAAASVGIALGGGTAQAMETADITLMNNDLNQLPFLYRLSRQTMQVIGQNIGLALGLKALFVLAVLTGAGSLWLAVLADVGASLWVTLNGMRLLRFSRT